jgi:hypothetical protein
MILESPDKFHEHEVEITGVFRQQSDERAIFLTSSSGKNEAIRLEGIFFLLNTFYGFDGKKVKVRGIFDKTDRGAFQYAGTLEVSMFVKN